MSQQLIIVVLIFIPLSYSHGSNNQNMNGDYLIGNPNHDSPNKFSTSYSTYPNVEYFDAYSPPISTR